MLWQNLGIKLQHLRSERKARKSQRQASLKSGAHGEKYTSKILGTGSYLPERKLTNHDLEQMLDTSDAWIRERTGIESRHINAPGEATSDLAFHASIRALQAAKLTAHDIDAILVATVTPDQPLPSTACFLQARLNCREILAFDLSAACSGFLYALRVANDMISNGGFKNILIVGADSLSTIANYEDRQSCILFGDGAGAIILSRAEPGEKSQVLAANTASDGKLASILQIKGGGSRYPLTAEGLKNRDHLMTMDGKAVFKSAVHSMKQGCVRAIEQAEMQFSDVDIFLIHQANLRIIENLAVQLKSPREKFLCNIAQTGNTSSASIPILMDQNIRSGVIKRGQVLMMGAFGAGVTSGTVLLKY